MLSLALEFASITRSKDEAGGESKTEEEAAGQIDQGMRDEAASELEAAVKSTKMKLSAKEVEFASTSSPDDNDITRKQIADVKENLVDMETRVRFSQPFHPCQSSDANTHAAQRPERATHRR